MFVIVAAVAVAWAVSLGGLALFSANPITLNPAQVRAARYVVTATVSADQPDRVVVTKEWKQGEELGTIVVDDLRDAGAVPGETYLIPLWRIGPNHYRVTALPKPDLPPHIYPAVPEAERQLAKILARRARPE